MSRPSLYKALSDGAKPKLGTIMKDLIVINPLFKIDLSNFVPTFLPQSDRIKIRTTIEKLDNPKLKLSKEDLTIT